MLERIIKELPLVIIISLFLVISSILVPDIDKCRIDFNLLAIAIVKSLFFSITFALLSFNRIYSWIWFSVNLILFEICMYLILQMHTHINPLVLSLILQTNSGEVSEFFSTYFSSQIVFILLLTASISIAIFYVSNKAWTSCYKNIINHIKDSLPRVKYSLIVTILCVYVISLAWNFQAVIMSHLPAAENLPKYVNVLFSDTYSPSLPYKDIYISFKMLGNNSSNTDKIAVANDAVKIDSCTYKSPHIIMVIGESFIKCHSNIYGYHRITNPKLLNEIENGNLYAYTDVITYMPNTAKFMQYFYSVKSSDDDLIWEESPLFPSIFKKAGYKVSLFDNQNTRSNGIYMKADYSCSYFINPQKIHDQCFDYRNSSLYKYDLEMVCNERKHMLIDSLIPSLNIIHLNGQHVAANKRYPHTAEYEYYTQDSVPRKDLVNNQEVIDIINGYDNATRYNDKVIYEIINMYRNDDAVLIYVSDHGDCQCDDYNLTVGRKIGAIGNDLIKLYLEVPMIIWCSDKYKLNHPSMAERIAKSVNRPFMTDDLCHLLFELSGIESVYYDPKRSLLNPQYKERERITEINSSPYNYDMHKFELDQVIYP